MSTPDTPQDPKFASPDGKRRFASEEASKLSDSAAAVGPGQNPYLPAAGSAAKDADDPSRVFGQAGPYAGGSPGAPGSGGSTTASGYPSQAGSGASGYSGYYAHPGSSGGAATGQPYGGQGYASQGYPGQHQAGQPYAGQNYPAQPGYPMYPQGGYPYPMQDQRKGFSIASMVLGILSVPLFFTYGIIAVLAVIFGHIGLKREPAGKGMAITGLVLGYIMLGLSLVFILFFVMILGAAGFANIDR